MANSIANLWQSYGVTGPATGSTYGIREDLGDFITIIDPDEQPTVAVLEKTTTNGLYHEWLTDTLAATSTAAAAEGDIITLSPACASFDLFKNYETRGEVYKELVNALA